MVDGKCVMCRLPDGSMPEEWAEDPMAETSLLYEYGYGEFPNACKQCDGDPDRCTACLEGYFLADGKCKKKEVWCGSRRQL